MLFVSASKNDAGIIADVLLRYTTSSFEALTIKVIKWHCLNHYSITASAKHTGR